MELFRIYVQRIGPDSTFNLSEARRVILKQGVLYNLAENLIVSSDSAQLSVHAIVTIVFTVTKDWLT